MSFHGESVAAFGSRFQTAVDGYIVAPEALGSQPEKPAGGKLMLRIAPTVHAAALKAAAQRGARRDKSAGQALGSAARKAKPPGAQAEVQ